MNASLTKKVHLAAAISIAAALIIWIRFFDKSEIITQITWYDWNKNGYLEKIYIEDNQLFVIEDDSILFQSEKDEIITDFEIGDINNDKTDELIIGFWRYGDYGTNKLPYLKSRRGNKLSYHLFLYQYIAEIQKFHLIWGSSTLPHPIYDFQIKNDGTKNYLKVKEGSYEDFDRNSNILPIRESNWMWNEWWFENF